MFVSRMLQNTHPRIVARALLSTLLCIPRIRVALDNILPAPAITAQACPTLLHRRRSTPATSLNPSLKAMLSTSSHLFHHPGWFPKGRTLSHRRQA